MEIGKLEEKIFNKEIEMIEEGLVDIGKQLAKLFEPYGAAEGQHGKEFKEFLNQYIFFGYESYFVGYSTRPAVNTGVIKKMPDALKKIVLDKAVSKFMERVDEIQYFVRDSE